MTTFSKIVSILFHPILMAFAGVIAYYSISPLYITFELKKAAIITFGILCVAVPLLFAACLKVFGMIKSLQMDSARERIFPLIMFILINSLIVFKLIPKINSEELMYFFSGIIACSVSLLIMALFKVKASIHCSGIAGLIVFLIGLSIHFSINITFALGVLMLILGATATARLYLKAHTSTEIVLGIIIGGVNQLFTFTYWL